jgi:hypothetical protein
MAHFKDTQGNPQQVEINLDTVRAAADAGMSLRSFINSTYDTDAEAYGDAFSQMCQSEGLILGNNRNYGIRAGSLDGVLNGRPQLNASGAIVKNPSNQARVLLMPAIGALVEDKLVGDLDMNANAFNSMIALDDTISEDWLLWPEVNYSGPEAGRSQPIAQLAKPVNMLTLTTSEKSIRIPTFSMGIEWSEQATKYLNLDFISLSIARQVAIERNERANQNLLAMLSGDADVGQGPLSGIAGKVKTAVGLDATSGTGITQKAWMLWLYNNSKKRTLTHLVTDIAGAMAIENRSGKPVTTGDNPNSPRIDTTVSVLNPGWNANLPIFIVDPSVGWTAGTIMGIDARYAIQRVTSTSASYQAQEDFVLRRGSAMRFDAGSLSRRLYNDAFEVLTYS